MSGGEVTVQLDIEILITRVVLTSLILALYAYDLYRVFRKWIREPLRSRGVQFRALIRSSVLCMIIAVVLIGSVNSVIFNDNPMIRDALRFVGYVLIGAALVGGVALVADWRREEALA